LSIIAAAGFVDAPEAVAVDPAHTSPAAASPAATSLPEPCGPAREAGLQLLAQLDAAIPLEARERAQRSVDSLAARTTPADAWDQFGIVAMLAGHPDLAAWAGLKAVKLDWQPRYVTNAAVHLINLDKSTQALGFLNCAYASGYRSPFLFEALAAVYHRTNDSSRAKQYILQARELAPDDRAIEFETSIVTKAPVPPIQSPSDVLEEALAELEAHAQRALTVINRHYQFLQEIGVDTGDVVPRADVSPTIARALSVAHEFTRQARMSREEINRLVGNPNPPLSDAEYRQALDGTYNRALEVDITSYQTITFALLLYARPDEMIFWAEVLHISPKSLADEERLNGNGGRDATALDLVVGSIQPQGGLAHGAWADLFYQANQPNPGCATLQQAYQRYATQGEYRYNVAAKSFDPVATRVMGWAGNEAQDAWTYARRYSRQLRPPRSPRASSRSDFVVHSYQYIFSLINNSYRFSVQNSVQVIAAQLHERASRFAESRAKVREDLADWPQRVAASCLAEAKGNFDELSQAQWEAYRQQLMQQMGQAFDDPQVGFNPQCEVSIAGFSLSIDSRGQLNPSAKYNVGKWQWGGSFDVKAKAYFDYERPQGVSIGPTATISDAEGLAGKAEITLVEKWNRKTGQWETIAQVSSKIGFGLKEGTVGIACYAVAGTVTFHARTFLDAAWQYIKADAHR